MPDANPKFDRVRRPDPRGRTVRDLQGKEALYSTAPGAPKEAAVLVVCGRCDLETGLSLMETRKLMTVPMLATPHNRRVWARCPACRHRAWLHVRFGPGLRAFLRI